MAKLKLSYPVFRHASAVTCGAGALRALGSLPDLEQTAFLTSGNPAVHEALSLSLAKSGQSWPPAMWHQKPAGEPVEKAIVEAADFISAARPARLVIVGGGSVLDWARLACLHSAGLLNLANGRLSAGQSDFSRPELVLAPTTPATGAEAGDVAVYQLADGRKTAVVSPLLMADQVILDGRCIQDMPTAQLAACLCDALSHAIEANLSLVPLRLGKEAGLSCLRIITKNYAQQPSSSQRQAFMEAGFLGGIAAANCSVGIVHAFAHSMAVRGLSHARGNACALRAGLLFNADTPAMAQLLKDLQLCDVGALVELVQPVIADALEGVETESSLQALADANVRDGVANYMMSDVAIRSNPRRPERGDLDQFLSVVRETVAGH